MLLKLSITFLLLIAVPLSSLSLGNLSPTCSRREACQTWTKAVVMMDSGLAIVSTTLALPNSPAFARNLPESSGADLSGTGTVATLIPLVKMQRSLASCIEQILQAPPDAHKKQTMLVALIQNISVTLADIPTLERPFKRIFDEYSDPVSYKQRFLDQNAFLVYYSKGFDGPNRHSIEDDLPIKQTLQYGARNEAWIAWEGSLAELQFVQSSLQGQDWASVSMDEFRFGLQATLKAVDSYLELAPPMDVERASKMF